MAQFIINFNASLPASHKFILQILDDTHLFVRPDVGEMIKSRMSEFREQNTYEKPTWAHRKLASVHHQRLFIVCVGRSTMCRNKLILFVFFPPIYLFGGALFCCITDRNVAHCGSTSSWSCYFAYVTVKNGSKCSIGFWRLLQKAREHWREAMKSKDTNFPPFNFSEM